MRVCDGTAGFDNVAAPKTHNGYTPASSLFPCGMPRGIRNPSTGGSAWADHSRRQAGTSSRGCCRGLLQSGSDGLKIVCPGFGPSGKGLRYYIPAIGRWACRDPIGETGDINLLAFVRNASANGVDYLGMLQVHMIKYTLKECGDYKIEWAFHRATTCKGYFVQEVSKDISYWNCDESIHSAFATKKYEAWPTPENVNAAPDTWTNPKTANVRNSTRETVGANTH